MIWEMILAGELGLGADEYEYEYVDVVLEIWILFEETAIDNNTDVDETKIPWGKSIAYC